MIPGTSSGNHATLSRCGCSATAGGLLVLFTTLVQLYAWCAHSLSSLCIVMSSGLSVKAVAIIISKSNSFVSCKQRVSGHAAASQAVDLRDHS